MPLRIVHSRPVEQKFRASLCSRAFIFLVLINALCVICALLVAYRSQNFWTKTNTYMEQPKITFKNNYILLLRKDGSQSYIIWSTYSYLNTLEDANLRMPTLRSYHDGVQDNVPTRFTMNIDVPVHFNESIMGIEMMLFFDYRLELHSRVQMEAMVAYQWQSPTAGAKCHVLGDLRMYQRQPLRHRGVDTRFRDPLINTSRPDTNEFLFETLRERYWERDVIVSLQNAHTTWLPGHADTFSLRLTLQFPVETIRYFSGFWELIKFAWIQYLAVLVVFLFIRSHIVDFVFRNQLISTYRDPVKYS